jgi:hypothetical protein
MMNIWIQELLKNLKLICSSQFLPEMMSADAMSS